MRFDGFLKSAVVAAAFAVVTACGPVTGSGTTPIGDPCESTPECVPGSICFNEFCVGEGALRVSLSFTAGSDFDLHLLTPGGSEIYWNNDSAEGGVLDVDQCVAGSCDSGSSHVENIVFSADAPSGTYEVWVENYDGRASGSFNIEVRGQATDNFSGTLSASAGEESEHFTFSR